MGKRGDLENFSREQRGSKVGGKNLRRLSEKKKTKLVPRVSSFFLHQENLQLNLTKDARSDILSLK